MSDGSTQLSQYTYNSFGGLTQSIDPLSRATNYSYAANGIDLAQVTQLNNGNNDVLFSSTYNSQHEPLAITDAAGQVTHILYNTLGQVISVTNALSQTTTYTYNSQNYLWKIRPRITSSIVPSTGSPR